MKQSARDILLFQEILPLPATEGSGQFAFNNLVRPTGGRPVLNRLPDLKEIGPRGV